MKFIHHFFILTFAWISMCIFPLYSFAEPGDSGKLTVYTVNYPLQYFAERIGGKHVQVVFPAPDDVDPAYWMPDKKTINQYQQADLILLNGAGYAKWTEKVTLPRAKMVNTSRKYRERYIKLEHAVTHSHGSEGKHAHEDAAFTTWLDLDLAAKQAGEIALAFSRKRPELKDAFQKNLAALQKDLMAVDRNIKNITGKDQSKPFMVSHPVYDYLASRYKLNIKSVHWEPDAKPDTLQWRELTTILKKHPAQCMIWEGEPIPEPVEKLQGIGMKSIVFDPCGNVPEQGNFLTVMNQNVVNLEQAF